MFYLLTIPRKRWSTTAGRWEKRWRGYASAADRKRAIKQLIRKGWNHFVCYRDVQSQFALEFGKAAWVGEGAAYVNW